MKKTRYICNRQQQRLEVINVCVAPSSVLEQQLPQLNTSYTYRTGKYISMGVVCLF